MAFASAIRPGRGRWDHDQATRAREAGQERAPLRRRPRSAARTSRSSSSGARGEMASCAPLHREAATSPSQAVMAMFGHPIRPRMLRLWHLRPRASGAPYSSPSRDETPPPRIAFARGTSRLAEPLSLRRRRLLELSRSSSGSLFRSDRGRASRSLSTRNGRAALKLADLPAGRSQVAVRAEQIRHLF